MMESVETLGLFAAQTGSPGHQLSGTYGSPRMMLLGV